MENLEYPCPAPRTQGHSPSAAAMLANKAYLKRRILFRFAIHTQGSSLRPKLQHKPTPHHHTNMHTCALSSSADCRSHSSLLCKLPAATCTKRAHRPPAPCPPPPTAAPAPGRAAGPRTAAGCAPAPAPAASCSICNVWVGGWAGGGRQTGQLLSCPRGASWLQLPKLASTCLRGRGSSHGEAPATRT